MKRRRSAAEWVLTIVLIVLAVTWLGSLAAVLYHGGRDRARPADAIVVLGAAQYVGRPSPVFKSRLDHAVKLWKGGTAPLVILTGGFGAGDTTTEAEVGRKYVIGQGVPDSVILVENAGRSTSASLRTVVGMMQARELKTAVLVSDPFHMFRLGIIARRLGLEAYTSPTEDSPISANRSQVWRYVLGESIKAPLAFFMEKR